MSAPAKLSERVADWMAIHGGGTAQCARALGADRHSVEQTWYRIRKRLGAQAI
jgi:DNA-binding CsgD family transcriptional regulator